MPLSFVCVGVYKFSNWNDVNFMVPLIILITRLSCEFNFFTPKLLRQIRGPYFAVQYTRPNETGANMEVLQVGGANFI